MNNVLTAPYISNDINQFRETVVHGTPQFPMQIYKNDFLRYVNHIIDWHWHPEIEIAVVLSGAVSCFINDTLIEIHEGDGFFINSNTMHKEVPLYEYIRPIMTTVCFLPDFIGDCGSDLIFRKYIRPIVGDTSLKGIKLSQKVPWQNNILNIIKAMFDESDVQSWGYELKYRNMLGELWYTLSLNLHSQNCGAEISHKSFVNEKRLKDMISFMQTNYQRDITIDEIAKSANISKSECFRCFKSMIDKKPITYLNEFRLKQAVRLLMTTDMQITEICFYCGFNHISYFGKLFRSCYGMTPKQFRNSKAISENQQVFF